MLTGGFDDHNKDDHNSLWGSSLPLAQLASSSPVRGIGNGGKRSTTLQGVTTVLGLSAEDADLVAKYLRTLVVETVSIGALPPQFFWLT